MDSASNSPTPGLRQKLIIAASVAALLLAGLGLSTLHERTTSEVQARKNATALAFEKAPEQWLAHPREASERAVHDVGPRLAAKAFRQRAEEGVAEGGRDGEHGATVTGGGP